MWLKWILEKHAILVNGFPYLSIVFCYYLKIFFRVKWTITVYRSHSDPKGGSEDISDNYDFHGCINQKIWEKVDKVYICIPRNLKEQSVKKKSVGYIWSGNFTWLTGGGWCPWVSDAEVEICRKRKIYPG